MCDMLGSDPVDSEIPVEFDDLLLDVQEAMVIYGTLQDNWDTMAGIYLGKNFIGLNDIFDLYGVEDRKTTFSILRKIDNIRSEIISSKKRKPAH